MRPYTEPLIFKADKVSGTWSNGGEGQRCPPATCPHTYPLQYVRVLEIVCEHHCVMVCVCLFFLILISY